MINEGDVAVRNLSDDLLIIEMDKFQRYLDLLGGMIVVLDREGNVSLINKLGCNILGYDRDEIVGENWFDDFLPMGIRDGVKGIFNQMVSGEIETAEFYQNQVLTKSGEQRTILWHNDVIRDNDGNVVYTISSGQDITDMLIKEKTLKESEEKFRILFEQAMDPIFLVDAENARIVMFNHIAPKVYGYSQEEFEQIKIMDIEIIESEEEVMAHIEKIEKYGYDSFDTMHKTKDGRILHVHADINNIRLNEKSYHMGVFRDITRAKQIESKLIIRTRQLEEMNRTLEQKVQEQVDQKLGEERILLQQSKMTSDEIVVHAADILEEHGYVEESIEQILKIKKWKRFEESIIKHAQNLIDEGRHTTVDKWFSAIPYEIMRDYPWLLLWQGINKMYLNPGDARLILKGVYPIFQKSGCSDGQLIALCGIMKAIVIEWKDFHPLDYWIAEFEESLLELYKHSNSDREREAVVSGVVAALIFRQPGHTGIDYWLGEAERIVLYSKHIEVRIFAGYSILMYYLWTGAVFKAGIIVDILSAPTREIKVYPMLRLMYLRAEALYYYYKLSAEDVKRIVEEGLALAEQTGIHQMDTALLGLSVHCSFAEGDNETAGENMTKIKSLVEKKQSYSSYYYQLASLFELAKGDIPSAIEYGRRNVEMVEKSGCPFMLGINRYFFAYVLAEVGRYDGANEQLREIEGIEAATKSGLFIYPVSAVKALIALKTNDRGQFEVMFDKCVEFATVSGMRLFLALKKSVAFICKAALEKGIHIAYAKELIALYNITSDGHTIEDWPWSLKIYTLGRFELFRDGSALRFSAKPQKMPLLMLKAMIALGGRQVDVALLSDHLWPDSDGDSAQNLFSTNMHRLRKLVGGKYVITHMDGQLCLNPELCWVDTWAFDDITGRIDHIHRESGAHGDEEAMMSLTEKMCRLYRGDFIPGQQTEPLSAHMRGILMQKFINTSLKVGEWLKKRDRWQQAIGCYKDALSIYNSEELLYQGLMSCYQTLGHAADVISTYNMCREVLMSNFGVEPSPAVQAIYASSVKNHK
ncbi:PAS domain S-box protein [Candidatus Magnetominusculus dajiuhuensis]|uniref:PAS domain S-box protein n=1 Tax=Candidatus Magnetominusculus dajiuhuensis TaxID=3137712 RepID=UPI003B43C8AA